MNEKTEALMKNLLIEKVAVIHNTETVAFVVVDKALSDVDKCEKAFMLTNSITDGWWNNKEVTKMFGGAACRSTSVGDMVLIGNDKYKCEPSGWSKVAWKKPLHEWSKV